MKVYHDKQIEQVAFLDDHFYTVDRETYYPSVTTILSHYPKGEALTRWMKENGLNADRLLAQAAERGTKVHNAIDDYLNGKPVLWDEKIYGLTEWKMIAKFVEFWTTYKPIVIAVERRLISDRIGTGGTADLVCKIGEKIYLIDHKTSAGVYKTHMLQLSVYERLWNEANPDMLIDKVAVMHLNAKTRGEDKKGSKIQGKGWQLKEPDVSTDDLFRIFEHCKAIYLEENPESKPKNLIYPDRFQLNF